MVNSHHEPLSRLARTTSAFFVESAQSLQAQAPQSMLVQERLILLRWIGHVNVVCPIELGHFAVTGSHYT